LKVTVKDVLIALVIVLAVGAVAFYLLLPAVNIHDKTFTGMIAVLLFLFALILYMRGGWRYGMSLFENGFKVGVAEIAAILAIAIFVLAAVIGAVTSTTILRAASYQKLLAVKPGSFVEDIGQADFNNIPMLDLESAVKLGDRKMGELVDIVSQFEVAGDYSQINFKGTPVRVTPLEYGDIIKWFNNQKKGLPAYIIINMVTQQVTVQRLAEGMKYSFSDHFGRYLPRHLRFSYPTFIFDYAIFELDDNGHPFWVVPRVNYTIGLYGGKDVVGVVLCDAVSGQTRYYDLKDVPQWIDRAFSSELVMEQFDYYGTLKHGFWNSIFGQRDSIETTDGYNYIAMNDDIYMYTGVTSVGSDQSNVGFLWVNQRTKEAKFYPVPGADERSAMNSAQGQVQDLGYTATFPLLLNIGNQPTYFLALKDSAALVKLYAMVNVGQYQIVSTGSTVLACEQQYLKLLAQHGLTNESTTGMETLSGKITDIRSAVIDGNTVFYLGIEGVQTMFVVPVKSFTDVVTYDVGDIVEIRYTVSGGLLTTVFSIQLVPPTT
jgi:hypothetical protein